MLLPLFFLFFFEESSILRAFAKYMSLICLEVGVKVKRDPNDYVFIVLCLHSSASAPKVLKIRGKMEERCGSVLVINLL